jgi:Na+-driven multidrug efflux pump
VSQPLIAVHFALGGALRGAGDTVTPLWAAVVTNWGLRLPFALVAARVLGADVVWMWNALVIDHIVRTIWLTISFHRGEWARRLGVSTNGG